MAAFITGIGWITANGPGMGGNGDTFDPFVGTLPRITGRIAGNKQIFPRFGRLDRYSKLGLATIAYALRDAGLDVWKEKRDIGVIVSTVLGCISTDMDYYNTVMVKDGLFADPNLFTYTLSNSFLGHAATIFGMTGTTFVINDKTGSGIPAIQSALISGCDAMLAGICDVESPEGIPIDQGPPPGSIFLVIEKAPDRGCRHYGGLSMEKDGTVLLNGSEVRDIAECVKRCLEK